MHVCQTGSDVQAGLTLPSGGAAPDYGALGGLTPTSMTAASPKQIWVSFRQPKSRPSARILTLRPLNFAQEVRPEIFMLKFMFVSNEVRISITMHKS
ncbi:hypothetical protein C7964_1153 [Loktanella sp. PT4BL]|nr:hypothetical protein C7964_1153 [Loktanella sp. PT4BL]